MLFFFTNFKVVNKFQSKLPYGIDVPGTDRVYGAVVDSPLTKFGFSPLDCAER